MKLWLRGFYYSFPVQLLFLHFRRYQILLVFWFILFSVVSGGFMKNFGADALYLGPEYLGNVNAISSGLVGVAIAMFIMSWNVTTFILFSRQFRFLSTTTSPFLKYCINNSIIPLVFICHYFYRAYFFTRVKELMSDSEIFWLAVGFLLGFILLMTISFFYFFRADRSIVRRMMPRLNSNGEHQPKMRKLRKNAYQDPSIMRVEWYLESFIRARPTRDVKHYTPQFVDSLFKQHHFSAILSVFVAFLFLIGIGFFLESPYFQIPAAASITIFFSVLIGVAGAFSYFLQSWSIPFLAAFILILNYLYKIDWIDPRNKAYGINYQNKEQRPNYDREGLLALCSNENRTADSINMISILEAWKKKQNSPRPLLVMMNTSGGGHRSATFTVSVLQHLDSITNGRIMKQVFMISGASGGMIGASYFRELFLQKQNGKPIRLQDNKYVDDISGDLLNPVFSSFVARDLIAPAQKFTSNHFSYIKDRGYAFEEKLNLNTHGFLNKTLGDYAIDEKNATIPLMFFNSVITRDSRKMLVSTQPVSFMMQSHQRPGQLPYMDPDAVDFTRFFKNQDPFGLRMLTTLRMNATFPVVLPNVWLPSNPVIDVMDAGLRDNYGQETTLRFLENFDTWIRDNTSGVLILQIRDRGAGGWDTPYVSDEISDHATKPFLLLQHNWFKMMEYFQNDMLSYYSDRMGNQLYKVVYQYATDKEENKATLNFHLSQREKMDVIYSIKSPYNLQSSRQLLQLLKGQ